MHKPGTPWPVTTRVSYIVAFEELRRRHPRLSARRFCEATEVPYPTFARWWAAWRRQGKRGLLDRPKRPRHRPTALQGRVLDIIRHVHRQLGLGVRRLHAYLTQAGLISCSLSRVYRVLKRAGALVLHPRKPKPVWTRYAKALPGERGQMDLMYLPEGRYQFTLVDDCSRVLAATVLTQRTTAAGVPRIRLHDLRHTHATLSLRAGVHPKVVSERLGHSTISVTLDTYSHAIPAMQEEAAERVAALVFGGR